MGRTFACGRQSQLVIFGLLSLLVVLCSPQGAKAQDYPTKPITIVNPFGPGGHSDLVMRPLMAVAQKYLGQPIVMQMKSGGNGIIGTEFAAKSPPDGYTLLTTGVGWNAALPALEGHSFGPDEFEPVAMLSQESTFMTVRADSPYKTLRDRHSMPISWASNTRSRVITWNSSPGCRRT